MLHHTIERGVLLITIDDDVSLGHHVAVARNITHLVKVHLPAPVVIVLSAPEVSAGMLSTVLRAHVLCGRFDGLMAVVTPSAPARRLLEANADVGGTRLVVFARTGQALDAMAGTRPAWAA
ncbi:hypothetical protein J7E88_23550 [Streptomyces sp. ISL-10]|uniref:hypothetical protein n=1 Tax=Streptomyces sp. ISL-10 TaxID=2819172 RepID=UPI001BEC0014|nr:hypothetical protein [Streptomyces sp. ISL-10]MBT2368214.1 hypothetical protein [Streptomyces sp. ISL-10]